MSGPAEQQAAEAVPTVEVTEYTVCCLPRGDINFRHFALLVRRTAEDRWYVTDGFDRCLGADGQWADGVKPYGRGDTWLANHRHDEATAKRLAKAEAPNVTVNGITVQQAINRSKEN